MGIEDKVESELDGKLVILEKPECETLGTAVVVSVYTPMKKKKRKLNWSCQVCISKLPEELQKRYFRKEEIPEPETCMYKPGPCEECVIGKYYRNI